MAKLCRQKETNRIHSGSFGLMDVLILFGQLGIHVCALAAAEVSEVQNHHTKAEQRPLGSRQAADVRGLTPLSLAAAQIFFFHAIKPDCRKQISSGSILIKVSLRSGWIFSRY